MKKLISIMAILLIISINGIEFCGINQGFYINVKSQVYDFFAPIETISHGYIQIDSI